jgi:hypothetical protein
LERFMKRRLTSIAAAAVVAAGLLSAVPGGTASASTGTLSTVLPPRSDYADCAASFPAPYAENGKVYFRGGVVCSTTKVYYMWVWMVPDNGAPEAVAIGEGSTNSLFATSSVPCVDGIYYGSVVARLGGARGAGLAAGYTEGTKITC